MKVILTEITTSNDSVHVGFTCEFGFGWAIWLSAPPRLNHGYDVEFDCDEELQLGRNMRIANANAYSLSVCGPKTTLTARIEDIYDGTASLRFGDSIILVEFKGQIPSKGSWLDVITTHLALNDMSL